MKWFSTLAAGLVLAATANLALAQQAEPPRQPRAPQAAPANQSQAQDVEQMAAWLALSNHAEIQVAKLALEKTRNDEVKQLAQRMVEDHTQFLSQLRQFMPNLDETGRTERGFRGDTPDKAGERRPADTAREGDQPRAASAQQHHGTMLQVARQAKQIELELIKQLFEGKQGQDFDMGFLGQQIVAHTQMLATLHAMRDHGPQEFQQLVAKGADTTKEHLQRARQLAARLEDKERVTEGVRGSRSEEPARERNTPNPRQ